MSSSSSSFREQQEIKARESAARAVALADHAAASTKPGAMARGVAEKNASLMDERIAAKVGAAGGGGGGGEVRTRSSLLPPATGRVNVHPHDDQQVKNLENKKFSPTDHEDIAKSIRGDNVVAKQGHQCDAGGSSLSIKPGAVNVPGTQRGGGDRTVHAEVATAVGSGRQLLEDRESNVTPKGAPGTSTRTNVDSFDAKATATADSLFDQDDDEHVSPKAQIGIPVGPGATDVLYSAKLSAIANQTPLEEGEVGAFNRKAETSNDHGRVEAHTQAQKNELMQATGMHVTFKNDGMEPEQAPSKANAEPGPHVEYGFHDPVNEEGLAVAMPVKDDEEEADSYIQSAVEFDPDAKPSLSKRRQRFAIYSILALFTLLAAAVSAIVGVIVSKGNGDSNNNDSELPYRETLGIKERVERLVGNDVLSDPESPYFHALEWITHGDAMEVVPESPNFVQRYVCAYFYLATSENGKGQWLSCNPPMSDESNDCFLKVLTAIHPALTYLDVQAKRWLSSQHECEWAGIECDGDNRVRYLQLSKFVIL